MPRLRCMVLLVVAVIGTALAHPARAEAIRCRATRDTWISAANAREADTNGGRSPRIKLKVWQEFGLFDFDVSALRDRKITHAFLRLAPDGGEKYGRGRGTDLRWFTVSTVSSPWEEGRGREYDQDSAGAGATFNEASYRKRPWAGPGSKCWDVILGNGSTLRCDVDAGDPTDGWFAIPIDPSLVQAMVAGASYGLMVMDGSTGVDRNCFVSSREGSRPPVLDVEVEDAPRRPLPPPEEVEVRAAPNRATPSEGAAWLSLRVPEGAFAYRVRLNGAPLRPWQVPLAGRAGETQRILLEHLPPNAELRAEVSAVDASGTHSGTGRAVGRASATFSPPPYPAPARQPRRGNAPSLAGRLRVWAYPELCKLDPLTVSFPTDAGLEQAASRNPVWDAGSRTVRLDAARGEIRSFQLALEGLSTPLGDVRIDVAGIPAVGVRLWRAWFVKHEDRWVPEYAIPLRRGDPVRLPAVDNRVPGQRAAAVTVDLIVPAGARAGRHRGKVLVEASGGQIELPLVLDVHPVTLPPSVRFNPELNCYAGPGKAGTEFFFDAYRLAHYHRSTINRVPHTHLGSTDEDWAPVVGPDGRVTDWSGYDRNLGPLLDGSAFRDNPRAAVPVPTLYLPHNESWPLKMVDHYAPGVPLEGEHWRERIDVYGKPPELAFSDRYRTAFSASVADFVRHFEERGWNRTLMECYFNNKAYYSPKGLTGTAWDMDEPFKALDWHALGFFARLFKAGTASLRTARFAFRGDISRPAWQGSALDGLMDVMYANNGQFGVPAVMKRHREKLPAGLYAYGECNPMGRTNLETVVWCIKAHLSGCDGVLPWQSLADDRAFDLGDKATVGNALIVDGRKRFGVNAIASYRVHALRAGAELAELLYLLEERRGWSREQAAVVVERFVPLAGSFQQASPDQASGVTFGPLNSAALTDLRIALLHLLSEPAPERKPLP